MTDNVMTDIAALERAFAGRSPLERLKELRAQVEGRIVFTTSLGLEDQLLTDLIFANDLDIEVVTLDTGRLFPETYKLWSDTELKYGKRIRACYPETKALEALIADQGIDGFYFSPDMRKACCGVRKVEPLKRALAGAGAWVTGLRADQSANRASTAFIAFDSSFGLLKASPLADLSREAIVAETQARNIPVNALHSQGFPSIGCAPCTRAIAANEDERAGRWWWEQDNSRECGLHVTGNGKTAPEPALRTGENT
ncbi:MAG: phosphoadenylyl-sulfate reductase [Rhodoblastus sp.]